MKHLIFLLVIICCACNRKKIPKPTDSKVEQIANYLDSLEGFSGVVLIAKDDHILFKRAYGFAHLGHKIKNNVATKFSYASIGKSFTAVAIFHLIQQGKLSLQDNIGKYLPDYQNQKARDSVTIELLLRHKSGLPNYFHYEKYTQASKEQFRTLDDLTNLYENRPLEFSPGQEFAYRNTNYIVLGRIIEAITRMPYDNYIQKHIFSIADMQNTGNFDIDHITDNVAENYTLSDVHLNQFQKTIFMSGIKGTPAGGGYSTAEDLYKFATAFKHNKLLNESYTNLMKTEPDHWYGYGMQFAGAKGSGIYGHSGGHFGTGAEWRIFEQQGYIVALLTNKDLDQGFYNARFFIEKTISGDTPRLNNYFFTQKVINICLNNGIEQAKATIQTSKKLELSERSLNTKGYEMIKRGFYKKAIDLFRLEVLFFSNSYDAYDSLGEAYMKDGQVSKAIKNYTKSLEINPENMNAKEQLSKLLEK